MQARAPVLIAGTAWHVFDRDRFPGAYVLGLLSSFVVHPRWGLITYIAVFYLHPPLRWSGAGLPDMRWSLLAAVVTLISLPQAKLPPHATPIFFLSL